MLQMFGMHTCLMSEELKRKYETLKVKQGKVFKPMFESKTKQDCWLLKIPVSANIFCSSDDK